MIRPCSMGRPLLLSSILLLAAACSEGGRSDQDSSAEAGRVDLAPSADRGPNSPDGGSADMPAGPWVKIAQPADGAKVKNPVTFVISAGQVATVRIFADKWPLAPAWNPAAKQQLTYTFNGVNYVRTIELQGHDGAGKQVAAHAIKITVSSANLDKGQLVGQMWNTYYYLASEADHAGAPDTDLNDSSCSPIAKVSHTFSDSVCIEGSGILKDGRVINYAKTCSCGRPCPTGGIVCYSVLDKNKYPWGMGSKSNALVPLRSWAVDTSVVPVGTILYAAQWDGAKIPAVSGLGSFTHDGCFRADDVGGGIKGLHFDLFAGTKAMWQALEKQFKTKSSFTVFKNPGRCGHLKP